jgi:hypothetical protein
MLVLQAFARCDDISRRFATAGVIVAFPQLFLTSGWNPESPKGLINLLATTIGDDKVDA